MPIFRHECPTCGIEVIDFYQSRDSQPSCCGAQMRRLMPRRVVGRVVPDSNGVHAGSGFSASSSAALAKRPVTFQTEAGEAQVMGTVEDYASVMPSSRVVAPEVDPTNPNQIPLAPTTGVFAKNYEDCSAAERDERWRDGAQALAAFATRKLEEQGAAPSAARAQAADAASTTISKAREQSTRGDGLT